MGSLGWVWEDRLVWLLLAQCSSWSFSLVSKCWWLTVAVQSRWVVCAKVNRGLTCLLAQVFITERALGPRAPRLALLDSTHNLCIFDVKLSNSLFLWRFSHYFWRPCWTSALFEVHGCVCVDLLRFNVTLFCLIQFLVGCVYRPLRRRTRIDFPMDTC